MRKMSKAAKADAYDRVVAERDANAKLMWFLINSGGPHGFSPDAVETIKMNDTDVYEYRLYGSTRADGGTLAVIFHGENRHAHVDAHNFETWATNVDALSWSLNADVKNVAVRLRRVRDEKIERDRTPLYEEWK